MDLSNGNSPRSNKKIGLLKNQLQLTKRITEEGKERYEILPFPEKLSFDKGLFIFIRAVQLLVQKNEGVVIVGLAGPSGAGKTVFSEKVLTVFPGIVVISLDNYNDSSRLIDGNFDDPRLTDYDLLLENLHDLRNGKSVQVPIYDFKKSTRVGYRNVDVPQSRVIILEGIYALCERLRPFLDLRVSVTGGVHFDLVKRVLRDINRSGQAPEDIIQQISETVYPMYKAFIEPDLETAQLKIMNKFNPFSGFQNANYILKSPKEVEEDIIRSVLSPSCKEKSEETYDIYLLPPGEDRDTCQSYLRMRNRDGRYSLMFEECVSDGPFIISPRITFEVSVRLLGGLMALGYEITTILKRKSRVFTDEELHVTVKVDKLEQLHRSYVQVQGKERKIVSEIGTKLGLDSTYIPRTYIEQIQLEKLTKELEAGPEELKERFKVTDEILASTPKMATSWAHSERNFGKYLNKAHSFSFSNSERELPTLRVPSRSSFDSDDKAKVNESQRPNLRESRMKSGLSSINKDTYVRDTDAPEIVDRLNRFDEMLDLVLTRMNTIENLISESIHPCQAGNAFSKGEENPSLLHSCQSSSAQNGINIPKNGNGNGNGNKNGNGNGNGNKNGNGNGNGGAHVADVALLEEIRQVVRGQRHIISQLDALGVSLRDASIILPNSKDGFLSESADGGWSFWKTTFTLTSLLASVTLISAYAFSRTKP